MSKLLKEFKMLLGDNEVGLFFFAGHGVQIEGVDYLFAVDTDTSDEAEARHSSLSLDKVIDITDRSNAQTKIIVLDACRDNPWERAWDRTAAARGPVIANDSRSAEARRGGAQGTKPTGAVHHWLTAAA
jgi:uncharacterized caspase-like protein